VSPFLLTSICPIYIEYFSKVEIIVRKDLIMPFGYLLFKKPWGMVPAWYGLILLGFFWSGGCSIWNASLHPDYQSSRADRLCHPYGQCSQGTWVAVDGTTKDPTVAKTECQESVDQHNGKEWWADSVARGVAIGECMEKKGYRLQQ
jgi:hypothetical protein